MKYSLIVPYYRTPEITRLALHSMFHFAVGEPEVIVVDNAPGREESRMLDEFPKVRRLDNATALTGSGANFEALDLGIAAASHDLLGLVHSDTVFMRRGWDKRWFGHLERADLAALSTFEREANPFRPARKKLGDWWRHQLHRQKVLPGQPGKLGMFFVLTRRSTLREINFTFMKDSQLSPAHLAGVRNGVEVLSVREISRFMWHTSNITSLLTGQMDDAGLMKSFQDKRRRFLEDPLVRKHFAEVLARGGALK